MLKNISIIGSGSWATALVKIFGESSVCVNWLVRDQALARHVKYTGRNPRYLSTADLNLSYITPYTQVYDALADTQAVIFALPSAFMQKAFSQIEPQWLEDKLLISSIKGFIPGTGCLPGDYVNEYSGQYKPVMAISGPCHAEEIASERFTYMTVAGEVKADVKLVCDSLKVNYIRLIKNQDRVGVEYVAIIKNIIAVAAGIACGLNYGDNFQSVLISNAMREVSSFLHVLHPADRDLFDSAYFGDLLVTTYSDFSRNKTFGKLIGQGIPVREAIASMEMIAEGFQASLELHALTRDLNLGLPIINSVYRILYLHANPADEFELIEKQLR